MAAKGGIETKIDAGTVARAVTGNTADARWFGDSDWFGPGAPLAPAAPVAIEGRQFQFPISTNTMVSTKTEGLSFKQLRMFADACDIVRLLIETRKDQVCGLSWVVKPKDAEKSPKVPGQKVKTDPRVKTLTTLLARPDQMHSWSEWLRMVLEDMFVLDAPALYIQKTVGGKPYAFHPVDGGTIKRLIDDRGWTPQPPLPAYQQILQGITALDYTLEEMVYKPRNPRTNRIYGYGPVEQTIVTAQLILKREASNLEYYDTGNMPEGWLTGAADWTPEQLKQFQDILDAMLSGNLAERRKVRVVPHDSKYTAGKEPALKGDYDEWLARIACFAFSYPPTPFIKQMNRSTSDNAKESSQEEGLQPITLWVKELMDEIIQVRLGFDDLEFVFEDKEAQDPLERAQIDQIYVNAGVLTPNEVRADMGLSPLPEPQENEPVQSTLEAPVGSNGQPATKPSGNNQPPAKGAPVARQPAAQKFAKAADGGNGLDRDRESIKLQQNKLTVEIEAALKLSSEESEKAILSAIELGATDAAAQHAIDHIVMDGLAEALPAIQEALTAVAAEGAEQGLEQVGVSTQAILDSANENAVKWAEERAAKLITSDGAGGELVDATRDMIRQTVTQAIKEGWTNDKLAKTLRESYAFSKDRALTIARTELAFADVGGNMIGYIASGIVARKRWLADAHACPTCLANAAQGEIPLLAAFSSGAMNPPGHPRCECDLVPIVED